MGEAAADMLEVAIVSILCLIAIVDAGVPSTSSYSDGKRVLTRPMHHLPWTQQGEDSYPSLYLIAAFLDTRNFLLINEGKAMTAQIRLITLSHVEIGTAGDHKRPAVLDNLYCVWQMEDGSFLNSTAASAAAAPRFGNVHLEHLVTCETTTRESDIREGRGVPRFVTVAHSLDKLSEISEFSWVHVVVTPLIATDAKEVSRRYDSFSNLTLDSWLTKKSYEAGLGDIATLTSTPLARGIYSSMLPFQCYHFKRPWG